MSESAFATTILFKDIIPDEAAFREFVELYTSANAQDTLHAYLYKYIKARYCNSNIAYNNEIDFLFEFGIDYEDYYSQFKKRKDLIDKIYDLTEVELQEVERRLLTFADTPNNAFPEALDNLSEYVTNQRGDKLTSGKLKSYIEAVTRMFNRYLNDFLQKFRKHFINMYGNNEYFFEKE